MKRIISHNTLQYILFLFAMLWALSGHAQTGHSVTLTVTSPDTSSASPGTATILRASGACPASGVPSSGSILTSSLAVPGTAQYVDSTVVGGSTYCYWSTLKTAGGGSGVSNTFLGQITVIVQLTGQVQ